MKINTNVSSLTAQESATNTNKAITNSLEKLSSGLRVNKAADDASGLAIADKLRTQVTSVNQGIANGNSAVALLQIADKSMAEQSTILDTVKAKLIQANTDTTSSAGRTAIAKDIDKLLEQLNNIAKQTNYNGTALLQSGMGDGTSASAITTGLKFQIGETTSDIISTKSIQANISGYSLNVLKGYVSAGSVSGGTQFTKTMAASGQSLVDSAITKLNGYRGDIGSTQNQIESAVRNLSTQATNIKNAESVIRDVDYAAESANFNKLNIISQAGSYAISQANAVQQNVLRLLQ
ncbi:flagellin N-terminal helical domain-containing protein [Aliarcobacter butzleri]|uniref:flagellin N-terminal helical domain-containing protein n=1 Tax=Aliarcobacter butzleri TaxID=28197 RepID=UPI001EDA08DE|nr:flagellin [Aliarcobacter butzleri]MCG3711719.1 flagellin [Aliarcobacter butzleri]MCG3714103.1 flagellin [Aliarcobacter butzleri]MCT7580010.1 flagellin [Aliarcobacter butzleri]MCT7584784.1 flagellin [Aliarcobacter butzleri]